MFFSTFLYRSLLFSLLCIYNFSTPFSGNFFYRTVPFMIFLCAILCFSSLPFSAILLYLSLLLLSLSLLFTSTFLWWPSAPCPPPLFFTIFLCASFPSFSDVVSFSSLDSYEHLLCFSRHHFFPILFCFSLLPVSAVFLLFVGESCVAGQGPPLLPAAVEEEGEAGVPQEQRHVRACVPPLNSFPLEKTGKY